MRYLGILILFVSFSSLAGGLMKNTENENSGVNPIEALKNLFNDNEVNEENIEEPQNLILVEDVENHLFEGELLTSIPDGFVSIFNFNKQDDSIIKSELQSKDTEFQSLFNDCDIKENKTYPVGFYLKKSSLNADSNHVSEENPIYSKLIIKLTDEYKLNFKIQKDVSRIKKYHSIYYKYRRTNTNKCNDRVYIESYVDLNSEIIKSTPLTLFEEYADSIFWDNDIKISHKGVDISYLHDSSSENLSDFILKNKDKEEVTFSIRCEVCIPTDYEFKINPIDLSKQIIAEKRQKEKEEKERLADLERIKKQIEEDRILEEKEKIKREKEEQQKKDEELKAKLNPYKKECKELGFKEGSKKFKNCVVELME